MSPVRLRRNRHHVDDEDNDDENEVAVRYIPFTRSSKRPAHVFKIHVLIARRFLEICWTFAESCKRGITLHWQSQNLDVRGRNLRGKVWEGVPPRYWGRVWG